MARVSADFQKYFEISLKKVLSIQKVFYFCVVNMTKR